MSRWRHARAIAVLPGNVTIVVPAVVLIAGKGPDVGWGLDGLVAGLPVLLGVVSIVTGLALWCGLFGCSRGSEREHSPLGIRLGAL